MTNPVDSAVHAEFCEWVLDHFPVAASAYGRNPQVPDLATTAIRERMTPARLAKLAHPTEEAAWCVLARKLRGEPLGLPADDPYGAMEAHNLRAVLVHGGVVTCALERATGLRSDTNGRMLQVGALRFLRDVLLTLHDGPATPAAAKVRAAVDVDGVMARCLAHAVAQGPALDDDWLLMLASLVRRVLEHERLGLRSHTDYVVCFVAALDRCSRRAPSDYSCVVDDALLNPQADVEDRTSPRYVKELALRWGLPPDSACPLSPTGTDAASRKDATSQTACPAESSCP